jgi:hypothetical protein
MSQRGLELFEEVGDLSGMAMQVWDLAELATRLGRPRRAMILAGAALSMRDRVAGGAPRSLSQTIDVLATAGAQLPPDEASAALEAGRGLDAATAVAFALSDEEQPERAGVNADRAT